MAWLLAALLPAQAHGQIVAAESVYADIVRQVAPPGTAVTAILQNPATDPHEFEASPSVARAVAGARVVIENGAGYDSWMDRLLGASQSPSRTVLNVAALLHRRPGDNPHVWYDPAAMPCLVRALAATFIQADPAQKSVVSARRDAVLASLAVVQTRIAALRQNYAATPVAATEPVFGPMIAALGLTDRHADFERSVMNGTEPRAGDVASIEDDLRAHRIRALITNAQATDTEASRLAGLAHAEKIPIVPITETLPPSKTYQQWIGDELTLLEAALKASQ